MNRLGLVPILLLVAPLGCEFPIDDPTGASTTSATGAVASTSGAASTSAADSSTGGPPPVDCQEAREVPDSPFDCTGADAVLDGSVIIDGSAGSDDPSVLEGVAVVTGAIQVSDTALTNLDFMGCVTEVGADLTIFNNDMLTDVGGLHNITSVGTDFVFSSNDALVDFDGLPRVQELGTALIFLENGALESISGFHSLVGVSTTVLDPVTMAPELTGDITIQDNPVLLDINGLGGLRIVGGIFAVSNNPMLCASSVDCVGLGITMPPIPPATWTIQANDEGC